MLYHVIAIKWPLDGELRWLDGMRYPSVPNFRTKPYNGSTLKNEVQKHTCHVFKLGHFKESAHTEQVGGSEVKNEFTGFPLDQIGFIKNKRTGKGNC